MKNLLLIFLLLVVANFTYAQCPPMDQPQNKRACNGTTTTPFNFTSSASNVVYTWTNSNPAIGLVASGKGNLPAFNAVNTGNSPVTATITVSPRLETTQTFNYTGAMQTFVVPAGITSIRVDVRGSQGGSAIYNQAATKPDDLGGNGGRVVAEYPVTPGQTLYIFVGGIGYNGGGTGGGSIAQPNGGGASDIRIGGTTLTNRVIVAGGGGGGGNNCSTSAEPGGAGGGLTGATGWQCGSQGSTSVGQGGTQSAGGAAGTTPATAGMLGIGGNAGGAGTASGGGGGGYYGGGGAAYGGGGGGSSYTDPLATSVEHTQGFQNGTGQVIITYDLACTTPATKTFTYTIDPTPSVIQPADQSVFAGNNTLAVNFSSLTTGGYMSYDWTNNTPGIGLAASGTGNIPPFVATNTTNASLTATITVTPKLTTGILDVNQSIAGSCIANILQSNLAQSFKAVANSIAGAGIFLNSLGGNGNITISLWDKLPNAGGVKLATGTVASTPDSWIDVFWPSVSVTPGNTYYLVFTGTNLNNCIAGSSFNPYPDGQTYANSGYQSFTNFDYAFRTYSSIATNCTGSPQSFKITVKTLQPDANGILYVKKGSNGAGDSWANAIAELADALIVAKSLNLAAAGTVKQIWVAGGTYKPLYSPADNNFGNPTGQDNAFLLIKDVKVYGGFAGTESALAQRDLTIVANKSILSGDFNGDDVVSGSGSTLNFANNSENAYHVLLSVGDVGMAELNGFTIEGGKAGGGGGIALTVNNLSIDRTYGGGMNITSSSPVVAACVFQYNSVQTGMGGALYIGMPNNGIVSAPVISKSSFVNNKSSNIAGQGWGEEGAGALYIISSSPLISDCSFTGNLVTGSRFGGAVINSASASKFNNVTITNNVSLGANGGGGGLANVGASALVLTNVTLSGNSTEGNGGAISNLLGASSMQMNNVLITGNTANNGAGISNLNSSPVLTNVTISGNQANAGGGIYNSNGSSPQLQNTIVFGNSSGVANNTGTDMPIYKNSLVQALSGTGLISFNGAATDLFVSPQSPGLTTGGNYRLKIGSPAINNGDQTLFVGLDANTKDLDGNARLMGNNIDLGVYELQSQAQSITAGNQTKTYGDAPFVPVATASSGLEVSYASADNTIAEAFQDIVDGNKWKLNIKKAGTVNITASQAGGSGFDPATDVIFSLTINKKPVNISIKPTATFSKVYDANTAGTFQSTDLMLASGEIINNDDVQLNLSSGIAQYDTKEVGNGKTIILPIANVLLSGAQAANYSIANIADLSNTSASITPKPLTITANNATKVYDGFGYSGGNGVSYGTFALGEDPTVLLGTLAYGGTSQGAINTGTYTLVPSGLSSPNYTIAYVNGQLNISLNNVNTLAFNAQTAGSTVTKTYGDADINASAIASSGLTANYQSSNQAVATVSASGQVTLLGTGITTITVNQAGDANYGPANPIAFQVQVAKKVLTVTANDFSKTYNGLAYSGGNGVSYNGFVNGDLPTVLNGTLTYSGSSQGAVNTGIYAIVPGGLSSANYDFDYRNGTLNIVQSGANVITFNSQVAGATQQLTYGNGNIDASAIASSGLAVSYASSNPAVASVNATGQVQILAAGTATITASQPGDVNHAPATAISFNINVQQKALTITANNFNKTYDGQSYTTGNGVSYNGFVNGENEQNLQGTLSYIGTAIGAKGVGSYFISPTGYTSNNYAITYQDGSLTITKASLTINATAKTKIYGDADPALTYTSSGLIGTDAISGALARTAGENVGSYTIRQGTLDAGANYSVSYQQANLSITPKTLNIVAQTKSKIYGDADPALTYTSTGLVGTDAITGSLARATGENVGNYAINQGNLSAGANYSISYVPANLTITAKTLTITAVAKSKIYGDTDPALTYTNTGLTGTDAITGSLARAAGENVGNYAIGQGSLSAGANYTIAYNPANLTITKALLILTANNKVMCQNSSLPIFSVSYSGFKNGDTENSLSNKPTVTTNANNNSLAGTYVLTPTGAVANNYSFNYVNGSLVINPLPIVAISSSKGNSVSKGETLSLSATGGQNYTWANANGIISGQNTAVLNIRPSQTTTYTVTATNANGCSQSSSITIEVRDDFQAVKANNILTPNGDGVNDIWTIENIDAYPNNLVQVFDRAGRVLFTKKGYNNTWDGTVNGQALAEGTYYYIIDFGTNKLKQKGFITLIRQQ